jgi:sugar lactone lactonase YvrE
MVIVKRSLRFIGYVCAGLVLALTSFISYGQVTTTIAGGDPDGIPAIQTNSAASGMAIDGDGNVLYFARYRLRKLDVTTGLVTAIAASGQLRSDLVNAQDGPADQVEIGQSSIAVSPNGDIYLTEWERNRIWKFNKKTRQLSRIAGSVNGRFGSSNDGTLAINSVLWQPTGIIVTPDGDIIFAETFNHRLRKIDKVTGELVTIAGTGNSVSDGDGGAATSASLAYPQYLALDDDGNLYVSDGSQHTVRMIEASTGIISTIAGNGTAGDSGDGDQAILAQLHGSSGLTVHEGYLYIASTQRHRIRRVNLSTGVISLVAGNGNNENSGDGGLARDAGVQFPLMLSFDASDNLFVCAQGIIRKITAAGTITTVAGNGGFGGDGAAAVDATLQWPYGIAYDNEGNLVFTDFLNDRIRKIDKVTGVISTIAGTSGVVRPSGLWVDDNNDIYFVNWNGAKISKWTAVGGAITDIVGKIGPGYEGDDGPALDARLNATDVALDVDDNIIIADAYNHRIRKVDANTDVITTIVGDGSGEYNGDDIPASTARLFTPTGIDFDDEGNLFIADQANFRIRKVTKSTGKISTVAGNGTQGNSYNGPALQTMIDRPSSVMEHNGKIVITTGAAICQVDLEQSVLKVLTNSGTGYYGDNGISSEAAFEYPSDILTNDDGEIIIADKQNNRIRRIGRQAQTITFDPIVLDALVIELSAISSAGLDITFESSNPEIASISGSRLTMLGAGIVTVKAIQNGTSDYYPTEEDQILVLPERDSQTITFETLPEATFGDLPLALNGTTTSGLTLNFKSSDAAIVTIEDNKAIIKAAGIVDITAVQTGSLDYLRAEKVQTLVINKANQQIAFPAVPDKTLGDSPFTVNATSTSSIPITYTSSDEEIQIAGNIVTLKKAGRAFITANQPGNNNYNAATNVERSFCVNPPRPVVTSQGFSPVVLTSGSDSGNQWYNNGTAIDGATGKTFTATTDGSYMVVVTAEGCASMPSTAVETVIVGDVTQSEIDMEVYPNPVNSYIFIRVRDTNSTKVNVVMIDLFGREMLQRTVNTNDDHSFNVGSFVNGFYVVKIGNTVRKFEVRR